jgi:diguanylate cyclase (GGDEF)-like protein
VHAVTRTAAISAKARNRSTDPVINPTKLEDGTPVRARSTTSAGGGRPDPVVAPPDPSAIARLRALLDVTRLVRAETDPDTILEAIAESIATSLGFRTVVVNTYRPAWNDFQVTTVYGTDDAKRTLLGDTLPWEAWEPLLDERFSLGGAYMIPHGAFDWEDDIGRRYIPDWEPSASPDAWHPDDELFVPMRHTDGHLLGILSVGEPRSGARPSAHDVAGLVAVADHAALALQSAQEAAAAAFHRAALRQLLQVSSRLTETLSAGAILQSVCEGISEALGFDKVCIDLPDPVTGVFTTRAATGWTLEDMRENTPMTLWELAPLLDPPFERQGCFLLSLEEASARLPEALRMRRSEMNGRGPHAWDRHWLTVPMYDRDGEVIGLIWADDPRNRLLPSTELLQALRVFANQATAALDSASRFEEMRFLAEHDPLTRLYNRRAFSERLELESARAARYGSPMSLVLCDLNGFKALNDTHGHAAGDAALEQIGTILRSGLRRADAAYRIGGDEFALILPETSAEDAAGVAGRVSTAMTAAFTGNMAGLGASFGVAVCPADGTEPEALFRAADAAMYAAKRPGEGFALPRAG